MKRIWTWFTAQGLVARTIFGIVTAVLTALAVGFAMQTVFGNGGSSTPKIGPDDAPFTISTNVRYADHWQSWLREALPDPGRWPDVDADDEELLRFTRSLGGVDDGTWVRVVLDGIAGRTSTITDARAVVVERREPRPVALFIRPAEGSLETIGWYFDLDEPSAPARVLSDLDRPAPGPLYFRDRTVTIAPGEAATIDVVAATETCDCSWVIELDVVVDGTARTVRIDNHGQPFRTAGTKAAVPVYMWAYFLDPPGLYQRSDDGSLTRLSR